MAGDPVADLGGVAAPALVETAVLVLPGGRVSLGLGMTQQHQTAHGRGLDSSWVRGLIYKPAFRTR